MTFAAPPPASMSPMLAPLTPEEERQLAAMQQQLAAPQPTPTPAPGPALAAMAPTPAPTPEPIGPALAATEPRRSNASLAAYISAGGNDFRSIYPNLAPEEQAFIDGMRSALGSSGQMTTERELMLKALDTHLKSYRSNTIQAITMTDGGTAQVYSGPGQINWPNDPVEPKTQVQETADGFRLINLTTGESIPVRDKETRTQVASKPRISEENRVTLNQANLELDRISNELNQINSINSKYAVKNQYGDWEKSDSWFGSVDSNQLAARKKQLLEEASYWETKAASLDPSNSASNSSAPPKTPSPYSSDKDVRAALRAGKIDRATALQILRSQFNYK